MAEKEFLGIKIVVDDSLEPGTFELRHPNGETVRVINIDSEPEEGVLMEPVPPEEPIKRFFNDPDNALKILVWVFVACCCLSMLKCTLGK